MKRCIVRFFDMASTWRSKWLRRPAIVVAVIGLAVDTALRWLLSPLYVALCITLAAILGAVEVIIDLRGMGATEAHRTRENWSLILRVAIRIWRAAKPEGSA